jgi:hypothetical protein
VSFRLDDESFGEEMENKLYVGNLPYAATEDDIKVTSARLEPSPLLH